LPSRPNDLEMLRYTLTGGFHWLYKVDQPRTRTLLQNLLAALRSIKNAKFLSQCGEWLAWLDCFESDSWAKETLQNSLGNLTEHPAVLEGAWYAMVRAVFPHIPDKEQPAVGEQSQRAIARIVDFGSAAKLAIDQYFVEVNQLPPTQRPSEAADWVKWTLGLFDFAAVRFRFQAEEQSRKASDGKTDAVMVIAWWESAEPILDVVLKIPTAGIAFHLVEGFNDLIKFDILRGLHWLRRATEASLSNGLVTDITAASLTIRMLERTIAEHLVSLKTQNSLRDDFVAILEAYLEAGWPGAVQLAAQIETIVR
jgi:hypothetical protein